MSTIIFKEIAASESGIDYTGMTYGGAWGDVNGDGYPDIWLNNHYQPPKLDLNQGNGTFKDVTSEFFVEKPKGDFHGTAWADFDNDGDQDLAQMVGAQWGFGTGPNHFYVNQGEILENQATFLGIDYPLARGRGTLWLDFNKDGFLDLVEGAAPRRDANEALPKIFVQVDGTFEDVSDATGFDLSEASFFVLSDLSGDGNLDLIAKTGITGIKVYNTASIPFTDITAETIGSTSPSGSFDIASGDFNGDLLPDLYLTRGAGWGNDLYQSDSDSAIARLVSTIEEKGINLDTEGEVTFDLWMTDGPLSVPLDQVYIGANGIHPANWKFTLSPDNEDTEGIFPHIPGVDRGIYIGYDSNLGRWQLLLSSPSQNSLTAFIEAEKPISQSTAIGFVPDPLPAEDQLLINTGHGFVNQSLDAGINSIPIRGASVVAGDFDNDMDEDIYIVTRRSILNTPDILYENQGDGTFIAIPDAGGAAGTTLGTGDFVVTADYDLDGFLDLLVGNGLAEQAPFTDNVPYQLFHNQGNDNHWLEIDLEGVLSNRDGIGAQVFLTTNGITQLRQQDGGIHNSVQDHQRIHFGLGDYAQVDSLTIRWSSGIVQRVVDMPADQVILVKEPTTNKLERSGSSKRDYLLGTAGNDLIKGFLQADTLRGEEGNDTLNGGMGNDLDVLYGGNGEDLLRGREGDDVLNGDGGNDTLNGGAGADTMSGGDGNDIYVVDNLNDKISEISTLTTEIDSVQSSVTYTLGANLENLTLTGIANANGTGNARNNLLTGNTGNNILNGRPGNDSLIGGAGNDVLNGAGGNDNLGGGDGNDVLNGGGGNDILNGGNGNDVLVGDLGNDTLWGGAGSDRFTFSSYNSVDVIKDFHAGEDVIAISAAGFGGNLTVGESPQLQLGSVADDALDRFIYNQNGGSLFFDRDGNGIAFAQAQIAILSHQPTLSNIDLIII
jgi:Ca2+-binding RTX toxin-like protein